MISYLFKDGICFWGAMQILALLVSLLLVLRQVRLQNKVHLITSVNILLTKWRSEMYLKARRHVCENYSPDRTEFDHASSLVAGFFEEIGVYWKKGVIDEDILWEFFSDQTVSYWAILKNQLLTIRKELDDSFFNNFISFYQRVQIICKKKKLPHSDLTAEEISKVIKGEMNNIQYLEISQDLSIKADFTTD